MPGRPVAITMPKAKKWAAKGSTVSEQRLDFFPSSSYLCVGSDTRKRGNAVRYSDILVDLLLNNCSQIILFLVFCCRKTHFIPPLNHSSAFEK